MIRVRFRMFALTASLAAFCISYAAALAETGLMSPSITRSSEATSSTQEHRDTESTRGIQTAPGSRATAGPPKIVVVVSKKNPVTSLKLAELRRVFLRQKTSWGNGWTITPYERSTESSIRQKFSQRVLGKKPGQLKEYWMNLKMTRGLKAPKILRSTNLVKRYLERVKGGIGYLYEHEVDDSVKVIEIENT